MPAYARRVGFNDIGNRVFALYGSGEYGEALTVVQNARSEYPEQDNDLTFWEACLLARIDRSEEALTFLAGGLDRGQWFPPGKLADADLDPVRHLSGWGQLAKQCAEFTEERMAHRPPPVVRTTATPAGTIVAIQGAEADQQAVASTWAATTPDSWTMIIPAGAEPLASGGWAWPHSIEASARSVKNRHRTPITRPSPGSHRFLNRERHRLPPHHQRGTTGRRIDRRGTVKRCRPHEARTLCMLLTTQGGDDNSCQVTPMSLGDLGSGFGFD